jgi:AraC-like DNA-binding protein
MRSRPVAAIAIRWGFASPAHFSRVFRRTYGIAPGRYRLLALQGPELAGPSLQEPSTALQPALMTTAAEA